MKKIALFFLSVLGPSLSFGQGTPPVKVDVVLISSVSAEVVQHFSTTFLPNGTLPISLNGDIFQALLAFAIILGFTTAMR